MAQDPTRAFFGDLVAVVTMIAVLWAAVFPGLGMLLDEGLGFVVFLFVALTLLGVGGVFYRALQRGGERVPMPTLSKSAEAQRTFVFLSQLAARLEGSDLPELLLRDARRALAELTAEAKLEAQIVAICDRELATLEHHEGLAARRAASTGRLVEIGTAADDFLRDLDRPRSASAEADPVERLKAARQALQATARELG